MSRRGIMVAAALLLVPVTLAGVPIGIFSEVPGHATAQVPGLAGVEFSAFSRPYVSPNGQYWLMLASAGAVTTTDKVVIQGAGPTYLGAALIVRENDPAPWAPSELVGDFSTTTDMVMGINDSRHFAFSNNTSGPTATDEYVVMHDGAWHVIAQEGSALPAPFADEVYGTTLVCNGITNGGRVGFQATATVGPLPTTQDDFLFLGNGVIAQAGVTVPGNQANGTTYAWEVFDSNDYYFDASGTNYIIQGDLVTLATTEDDVVVVNGNVVVQEGHPLPGTAPHYPEGTYAVREIFMSPGGQYMVRGEFENDDDYLFVNGAVAALTGDDVPGFAGEHYDDARFTATFFHMVGNSNGQYVFGAVTDNPDENRDAVIVYDNGLGVREVLLRQGDAVDLDGNGLLDDNAFIDIFNNDDGFLTNDLWFYFTADLINGAGTSIGQGYLALYIPEPGTFGLLLVGALALLRRR